MQVDEPAFARMLTSEQVDLSASVVALDQRNHAIGIALLAIRGHRSWCGGLGVIPSARRLGIGRRLMIALIDGARRRGLQGVELECIDGNLAARALYDDLRFRAKRRLDIFDGPITPADVPASPGLPSWRSSDPSFVWGGFADYHSVPRTWQNDESALRVSTGGQEIAALATGEQSRPDAYVMFRPGGQSGGRISLIDAGCLRSVANPRETLADLVTAIAQAYPTRSIAAGNVAEDEPLNAALRALGVPVRLTQTEMELPLR